MRDVGMPPTDVRQRSISRSDKVQRDKSMVVTESINRHISATSRRTIHLNDKGRTADRWLIGQKVVTESINLHMSATSKGTIHMNDKGRTVDM